MLINSKNSLINFSNDFSKNYESKSDEISQNIISALNINPDNKVSEKEIIKALEDQNDYTISIQNQNDNQENGPSIGYNF